MTYFELYDLPISLKIDAVQLKQKFYELSRKFHPDFFSHATHEEQADVLEKSALVNKAFKTFSKEEETIKYVLQLKGLLQEEEKYQLSSDFLMEVMEWYLKVTVVLAMIMVIYYFIVMEILYGIKTTK